MKGVSFMNNRQLQYAIALSKSLNFSQVAEKLGISQPALSKQIHLLEKELGVELFNRKQNPVSLTPAGEYFFAEAQELIYREEQIYRTMDDFKSGKKGNLNIGISPFRALYLMPYLCKRVREQYPDIKIILHEHTSDVLRSGAADGKYDFAIVNLPVDESILDIIPIEQDRLVLVVPNNMLELIDKEADNITRTLNFKYCSKLPFVVVSQSQEMRQLFDRICTSSNIHPNIAMEVIGLTTAWSMAKAGIGATLLPLQFVNSMQTDNGMTLFTPECDTQIRQPAIITRHGQYLSPYAKYAIDILKKGL